MVSQAAGLQPSALRSSSHLRSVWDLELGELMRVLNGHSGFISCVGATGNLILTGSVDSDVR